MHDVLFLTKINKCDCNVCDGLSGTALGGGRYHQLPPDLAGWVMGNSILGQ